MAQSNCQASFNASFNDRITTSLFGDSIENQWKQTVFKINQLFRDHECKEIPLSEGFKQHITKSIENSLKCFNVKCAKSFSLLVRRHDCSRCRAAFCKQCISYQRRLNYNGSYDINGQMQMVCEDCFNEGSQTIGQTRSHFSSLFWPARSHYKSSSNRPTYNRPQRNINFNTECQRLCDGFVVSVSKLKIGQVLTDMFGLNQPSWEQSSGLMYSSMANRCSGCLADIKILKRRLHCVICGVLVCNRCSSLDLIVYIPDEEDSGMTAKLAIIKILGCPSTEPSRCRYLRVCSQCNEQVQKQQISQYQIEQQRISTDLDSVETTWMLIENFNEKLQCIQRVINENLPKYCEVLEALDASASSSSSAKVCRSSNMQALAKAEVDLSDHFTKFVTEVYSMKNLKPFTAGQSLILQKMIRAKFDFYVENISQFRGMQRQLVTIVSKETLEVIQNEVDRNATNSCYAAVKQLLLEVIHECRSHRLDDTLPTLLLDVEEKARCDLKTCIIVPWSEHEHDVDVLIKYQIEQHRCLGRLPATGRDVAKASSIITNRALAVLERISLQFNSKASAGKFQATKNALKCTVSLLESYNENPDWVFVQA